MLDRPGVPPADALGDTMGRWIEAFDVALVDGDLEKAKKTADEIEALQKASHEVYKKMPRKKKE